MNKEVKQIFDIIKRGDPDKLLGDGLIKNIAEIICGAGYKNAEEVRKETAKEIYRDLYLNSFADEKRICPSFEVWIKVLKKYGVEVKQ